MIIYGLMKYIEKIPARYDKVMNFLTLGHLGWSRRIMLSQIRPGIRILDMGCGTGDFALACARLGAHVTCVDSSPEMLRVFREKMEKADCSCMDCSGTGSYGKECSGSSLGNLIEIHEVGVASMNHVLRDRKFDLITASLMLGELPAAIREQAIRVASELLDDAGVFLICDELWPEGALESFIYHLLFWIFFIPNFILTRTLIQPVRNLPSAIKGANLQQIRRVDLLFGAMSVLWYRKCSLKKKGSEQACADNEFHECGENHSGAEQ
jgi:SAM-dependent methyltransferase